MGYFRDILIQDVSYNMLVAPHTFQEVQLEGATCFIQAYGNNLSGTIYFEQSIDNINWSELKFVDENSDYTQLSMVLDASASSMNICGFTGRQLIRPILKTAVTGSINFKYLFG